MIYNSLFRANASKCYLDFLGRNQRAGQFLKVHRNCVDVTLELFVGEEVLSLSSWWGYCSGHTLRGCLHLGEPLQNLRTYLGEATPGKCAIPWPYPGHSRLWPGYGQGHDGTLYRVWPDQDTSWVLQCYPVPVEAPQIVVRKLLLLTNQTP